MKDEIKEILDDFKIYEDRYKKCNETQFIIFYRDIHLLLDYITNLQQEKEDYKSRIDKAISYIKENGCFNEEYKLCTKPFNTLKLDDLLDILQGVDKE